MLRDNNKMQTLNQKVLAKLSAENLSIMSEWSLIEECLSKVVAPTMCIEAAREMKQQLAIYFEEKGYWEEEHPPYFSRLSNSLGVNRINKELQSLHQRIRDLIGWNDEEVLEYGNKINSL